MGIGRMLTGAYMKRERRKRKSLVLGLQRKS
jgi:hypothetical protein